MRPATAADGQSLGLVASDGGLELRGASSGGKTADGVPILLTHKYGRGCAILLNVLARDYQIWRTLATEMPFRDAVARIAREKAALEPPIKCDVSARGEDTPHRIQATEFHRYRLGAAEYVAALRCPKLRPDDAIYLADPRPKMVWLTFARKAHVYDARRRMYRGLTDRIEDVIYPARAELYALLPYEVRDLKVTAKSRDAAVAVSAVVICDGDGATPTTHVLNVTVIDPTGQTRAELARNVVAENGRCEERIFIGYNARPGTWRVVVRDAATGMQREATITLAPAPADAGRRQ
jgi:hypothetical protein